jgi:biopolymer transport protein TolQ
MDETLTTHLVTLQVAAHQAAGSAASGPRQIDPWQLVLDASPMVKMVMLLLVVMSLACWFIIGGKLVQLARAAGQSRQFLDVFWDRSQGGGWSTERLEAIYGRAKLLDASPLARVFHAGFVELARLSGAGGADRTVPHGYAAAPSLPQADDLDNVERALKRAATNEITALENLLPFLATTGSVAPFVGLFGTVWGVMNSFIGIGNLGNASLAVVAPGIAEALIATAIGLAAAIPAVMAYNYFVRRIRVLESEMDAFASDYLNIVKRHFLAG